MNPDDVIPPGADDALRATLTPPAGSPWILVALTVAPREVLARFRHGRAPRTLSLRLGRADAPGEGARTEHFCARFSTSSPDDDARALRATLLRALLRDEGALPWPRAPAPAPVLRAPTRPAPLAPARTQRDAPAGATRHDAPDGATWVDLVARMRSVFPGATPTLAAAYREEWSAPRALEVRAALVASLDAAARGAHETARAAVDRARVAAPGSVTVATVSALAFDALQDFDRALDALAALHAAPHARAGRAATFALQRRYGWFSEAWQTLDALRADAPDDPATLREGAALAVEARHFERAAALLDAAISQHPNDLEALAARARVALAEGDDATLRSMRARLDARIPDGLDPERLGWGLHLGDFADVAARVDEALRRDPANDAAQRVRATLHLWRGEVDAAEARLVDAPWCHRLRGAARVLRGDAAGALDALDAALRHDPGDSEAWAWRAEALLLQGRADEADAIAAHAGSLREDGANDLPTQLLRALARWHLGRYSGVDAHGAAEALAHLAPGALAPEARLRAALRAMGGNRGATVTWVDDGALRRLPAQAHPRALAKHAVQRFTLTASVDAAREDFARIAARWPEAAETHNYEGEVHLYVGDYAAAQRCFERALAKYGRSRWAFIGLLAVAVLEGRPRAGLEVIERGVRESGPPGPTAYVYRGEALRCLGRNDEALADLAHAVRAAPTRVGAWVNLGMIHAQRGDEASLRTAVDALRAVAPGFVSDLARASGLDVSALDELAAWPALLPRAFTLLRGNRASSCVTWFTPEGRLRTALTRAALDDAPRVLAEVAATLGRA